MADMKVMARDGVDLSDATRQAAIARIQREPDAAYLLIALGLAADPEAFRKPLTDADCHLCGNRLPAQGVCRKRRDCRDAARKNGHNA